MMHLLMHLGKVEMFRKAPEDSTRTQAKNSGKMLKNEGLLP